MSLPPSPVRTLLGLSAAFLAVGWGRSPTSARPAQEFAAEWPTGLELDMVFGDAELRGAAAVDLGRALFFDPGLSQDASVSCATCHDPERCFTTPDPLAIGIGGRTGTRNTPTIVNRAFGLSQFWDGRAATLAEQALGPLLGEAEMGMTRAAIEDYLSGSAAYRAAFQAAFQSEPTLELTTEAIASFEMTVVSGASPFDRFEWEGDRQALSEEARRGLQLFRGKARCSICHIGVNLSDEAFHNLGAGAADDDPGRFAVTGDPADRGRFKTPSLRNIALTAPYMHNGSLATLTDVVDFYDQGGGPNENLDPELRPLELTDGEQADLVAFLESLTGPVVYLDPGAFVQ